MTQSDDRRRFNGGLVASLIAIGAVLLGPSSADAQATAQFDLNQFRPSELRTDGFAVSNADGRVANGSIASRTRIDDMARHCWGEECEAFILGSQQSVVHLG